MAVFLRVEIKRRNEVSVFEGSIILFCSTNDLIADQPIIITIFVN